MKPRILVCGSRSYDRHAVIHRELARFRDEHGLFALIHGAAPGADSLAAEIAAGMGMEILPFPADWHKHGNSAGPIRNRQMLTEGKPDLVMAFHHDPWLGKGTRDMVKIANKAGLPIRIFIHKQMSNAVKQEEGQDVQHGAAR